MSPRQTVYSNWVVSLLSQSWAPNDGKQQKKKSKTKMDDLTEEKKIGFIFYFGPNIQKCTRAAIKYSFKIEWECEK